MQEGMNSVDRKAVDALDGQQSDRFIDAQDRKTGWRRRRGDVNAADQVSVLMSLIEQDVIPKLVSDRRMGVGRVQSAREAGDVRADQVARFARSLLGHAGIEPSCLVAQFQADGLSVEHVYLKLLAPAARHVGAMWDDDLCTFVEVTLALGSLHRLMLSLSADCRREHRRIDAARRVLLVQAAGGQHTFGLQMVAEFFRRGAWSVDMAPSLADAALARLVRADWFTVIGFSAAREAGLDDLAKTIRLVRSSSANPSVGILVGGPAFIGHPENVERVAADRMAVDALQAVIEAERFVLRADTVPANRLTM